MPVCSRANCSSSGDGVRGSFFSLSSQQSTRKPTVTSKAPPVSAQTSALIFRHSNVSRLSCTRLAGGQMVDPRDVARFEEAAQVPFEAVNLIESRLGRLPGVGPVLVLDDDLERGRHRLMGEAVHVGHGRPVTGHELRLRLLGFVRPRFASISSLGPDGWLACSSQRSLRTKPSIFTPGRNHM